MIDVVLSDCIMRRGAVGSSQSCVMHDLQFVNAGRGCKRRPYGRGILQSQSQNCLTHPVEVSAFMICRGLCACTEM